MLMTSEAILLFLLLFFLMWYNFKVGDRYPFFFWVYGFLFSFFCGFQFPVVTEIIGAKRSPAAGCIAADLAGAAVGTFVVGTLFIPLMGIRWAIIFLLLIKITSGVIIFFIKKKRL